MKTIYLLPFNAQNVQFSLNKSVLEQSLQKEKGLPYQGILEVEIEDELAQKLQNPTPLKPSYPQDIPKRYFEQAAKYLNDPPEWKIKEGNRIYIIFSADGHCFWSPSGNNLNGIKERSPIGKFISSAIRVNISKEAEIRLDGYFEWTCDNF